jgi:hypothetical protein
MPPRWITIGGFICAMIMILMLLGGVLHSFPENPLIAFIELAIVLAAAVALVLVFVKLIF